MKDLETLLNPENILVSDKGVKDLSDEQKMALIEKHFSQILRILGLDQSQEGLKDSPKRIAKMYVKEIFYGLQKKNQPKTTLFENEFQYKMPLIEKNIPIKSICEHHFMPIVGKAHVAYIPNKQIIGLSKLNRIVDYIARKPQVQECLTQEIVKEFKTILQTEDIAVYLDCTHMCMTFRGVKDDGSSTVTSEYSGRFKDTELRKEFLDQILRC